MKEVNKMKMIVGLGNPGDEYKNTRHNIGFMAIDNYVEKNNLKLSKKFNGLYCKVLNSESFILLKPLSFMNLSGTVVRKFADYYKIKPEDILIIQDDLDLPLGKIKLKYKGSSGGHNGIKNIIENLNTEEFPRLKIGVSNNKNISTKDYVLGKFSKNEEQIINSDIVLSEKIINDFLRVDFEKVMSKYNGDNYELM